MTKPTYACLTWKRAALSTEFGREWATRLFGAKTIAALPILKAGKNKGQPKGFVHWRRALSAGWCKEVSSELAVGQLADAWIGASFGTLRDNAVSGWWLGRVTPLAAAASTGVFFDDGRARMTAQRAREAADDAARWEEMKAELGALR